MANHDPLMTGFELAHSYEPARQFELGLPDHKRADFGMNNSGMIYHRGSDYLSDAVWYMANDGDPDALTILGVAAYAEVPKGWGMYEAIPGYLEPPAMPRLPRQRARTIFDLERELLALEEQYYDTSIALPAAAEQRKAKRAEKTPFDKA